MVPPLLKPTSPPIAPSVMVLPPREPLMTRTLEMVPVLMPTKVPLYLCRRPALEMLSSVTLRSVPEDSLNRPATPSDLLPPA